MSKTFMTVGEGSAQTLSELDTDKIPVYESMADVESDLANLEVGQIGATKDTGDELSNPVNVVEEGNLHAVTSAAVAGLTEKVTTTTNSSASIKWVDMPSGFTETNCFIVGSILYYNSTISYCTDKDIQILMSSDGTNKIGIVVSNTGFQSKTIDILLFKVGA